MPEPTTNISARAAAATAIVVVVNAAIDFNHGSRWQEFTQSAYLFEDTRRELLPAVARHHRHGEYVITSIEHPLNGGHRSGGIECQSGSRAVCANFFQDGSRVVGGLGMDRNERRARFDKLHRVACRVGDHQMHIEWQVGDAATGFDDGEAIGDVRHEVAVHDIEVQGTRAGRFDSADLAFQVAKIAEQERR